MSSVEKITCINWLNKPFNESFTAVGQMLRYYYVKILMLKQLNKKMDVNVFSRL